MAINSYDDILAAFSAGRGYEIPFIKNPSITTVAGTQYNFWWTGPNAPVAYSGGSTGVNGAQGTNSGAGATPTGTYFFGNCNSATPGALAFPFTVNDSDPERPHIVGASNMFNQTTGGVLYLVDRIADSGQLSLAAGATGTITPPNASPAWARSADGKGVMMWFESSASAPGGASVISLSYTGVHANGSTSIGTTQVTLALTANRVFTGNTTVNGPFIPLASAHVGVAPVTMNITAVSAATITNTALVVGRLIATVPVGSLFQYVEKDMALQTPRLPKLEVSADDTTSCLEWLYIPSAAASPTSLSGTVTVVVG